MNKHAKGSLGPAENRALVRRVEKREAEFRSSDRGTTHADRRRASQRRTLLSGVNTAKKVEVKPKKKVAKKTG